MRSEIAQPCCGSRASVRRISRSSVPCGSSILFCIGAFPCCFDKRQYAHSCRSTRGKTVGAEEVSWVSREFTGPVEAGAAFPPPPPPPTRLHSPPPLHHPT